MSRQIEFPVTTASLGRNGVIKTSGIVIDHLDDLIQFQPVTSRGALAANCHITIPATRSAIKDMVDLLESEKSVTAGTFRGRIRFDQITPSVGRNGYINTSGVELFGFYEGVTLEPINSRGVVSRCTIGIAPDRAVIQDVIDRLNEIEQNLVNTAQCA